MLIEALRPYIIAFIEIFIAIDIIGNIPHFLSLTEKYSHNQRKKIIRESVLYALLSAIIFILLCKYILKIIGITVADFKVSGGILLFLLAVRLLFAKQIQFFHAKKHTPDLGIFLLATPLIAGPALFIISLIILEVFGTLVMLIALIFNIFLDWFLLEKSEIINKFTGERVIKSLSRIFEILLAALAVFTIRQGIAETFFK